MTKAFVEDLLVPLGLKYIKVSVRVWEPETPRATAICVHSFGGDSTDFSLLAGILADHGFKTVALDLPGRGSSASLQKAGLYTNELIMACLTEMGRYRKGPVTFVGSGWGATMVMLYLAMSATRVSHVVLHEPLLAIGTAYFEQCARFVAESRAVFPNLEAARAYLVESRANLDRVPEPLKSRMIESKIRQVPAGFAMSYDPTLADLAKDAKEFDILPLIKSTIAPLLFVLSGAKDEQRHPWFKSGLQASSIRISMDRAAGRHNPVLTLRQCNDIAAFVTDDRVQ